MNAISRIIKAIASLILAAALPASLVAGPVIVRINDVPNAAPVVTVIGAPNGYDLYTGPEGATPGVEEGAQITLFGVTDGTLPEDGLGWRFKDSRDPSTLPPFYLPGNPTNFRELVVSVDIVWIYNDGAGNLAVGFNSALPGNWYVNGGIGFNSDADAGYITNKYVTLYASDEVVVQFKPHSYIAKKK